MVRSWVCKMSVLGRLAGGEDVGPGWCGGCGCPEVIILPESTKNMQLLMLFLTWDIIAA